MALALLTTFLTPYRMPLYERLATEHGLEVLCAGGGERYVPAWFADLDRQLDAAPFPARRLHGPRDAFSAARRYDAVIAGFAGGAAMPAAYAGAHSAGRPFVLWASVWAEPRSAVHVLARPLTRRIYRHADAVIAYGEHVRRFVAEIRGRDEDVFVAPQSVEAELFGRPVAADEVEAFRARHRLPPGPLVLYVGRLTATKGIEVLLDAWRSVDAGATLVMVGDGELAQRCRATSRVRLLGPLPRPELAVAYAAGEFAVLPSIPTARFKEPWGLVCNEAMHQGTPVIASDAVGAAAGGLVQDERTGLVVRAADPPALGAAIARLLADPGLRERLGTEAREAVCAYNYDAMALAFERAIDAAIGAIGARPARRSRA